MDDEELERQSTVSLLSGFVTPTNARNRSTSITDEPNNLLCLNARIETWGMMLTGIIDKLVKLMGQIKLMI